MHIHKIHNQPKVQTEQKKPRETAKMRRHAKILRACQMRALYRVQETEAKRMGNKTVRRNKKPYNEIRNADDRQRAYNKTENFGRKPERYRNLI